MLLPYNINRPEGKFDFDSWIERNEPPIGTSRIKVLGPWYDEYQTVKVGFKIFLLSFDNDIMDENGTKLTPLQIYNAIEFYKIRIQKLWLIIQPKMYFTHNENKATGVRYVSVRGMWIDQNGQMFKRFSKNLGAEEKIKVNGKIPDIDYSGVRETMTFYMQDLYSIEYSVSIKPSPNLNPEIMFPPS